MCGITGVIAFREEGKKYLDRIGDAVKALHHRGPDANGIFRHENIALGHARLAIIDTSEAAAQPFTSADGRYTIIFNGEIFNFRELRASLEKDGVVFRSSGDTEVLLALYIRDGQNCLEKLNGFFAFAIHDRNTNGLFLARDRFGEKPFYYYSDANAFLFASEICALEAFGVPVELNREMLPLFLHLNYTPECDETLIRRVSELPAGSFLHLKTGSSQHVSRYYHLPVRENRIPYEEARKKLRDLLQNAVEIRLESDVPLGSFLSGGIDSSIITALAKKSKNDLETFSIGFADEPFFDETAYAKEVADHLGTKHHVFSLRNDDLLESLLLFLNHLDEPFADSSALAVNLLARETRKHVTVALSGDGADEMFGGYNKHEAELRARKKNLSNLFIEFGSPMLKILPSSRNSGIGNSIRQINRYAEGLKLSPTDRYFRWAGYYNDEQLAQLIELQPSRNVRHIRKELTGGIHPQGSFNEVLRSDMRMVLEGDMLVKVDRMSMLHGLEVRPPFLDHRLVDFVMELPAEYKIVSGNRKRILKDAFQDLLPSSVFHRKKQGFEVPMLKWFRNELSGMIEDHLNEKLLLEQQLFNAAEVKRIRKQLHSSAPGDSVAKIWGLLVFQKWYLKHSSSPNSSSKAHQ